jgi:hypothetical protein
MPDEAELNLREQIARIDRVIIEGQKFALEAQKFAVEQRKLDADSRKLDAEARLFDRNRWQGWQVVIAAMTAGAALTGAVAGITLAVVKLVG